MFLLSSWFIQFFKKIILAICVLDNKLMCLPLINTTMYLTKVGSVLSPDVDISKEIPDKNTLTYYPKVQSSRV